MGALPTHVLDTAQGRPAAGLLVEHFDARDDRRPGTSVRTNQDGRCDTAARKRCLRTGQWELVFHVGEYFAATGLPTADPPLLLDRVTIRFGIAADTHYHVPLLVAPWGYTTYGGS